MKDELTLMVLAAGMGSRFGGLKQIEPIGPNGEFITDYSVYDAIVNGFKKVVFIIKKENLDIFKNTIGKRLEGKIEVEYAFQDDVITYNGKEYKREKPWGTAHAVLSAKDKIDGNFLMINSDDFYGRESYKVVKNYFDQVHSKNEFALVGYKVKNTLTENGSVKRGICFLNGKYLDKIIESKVEDMAGSIIASPLDGSEIFKVDGDVLVSMNMFLMTPYVFELIEEYKDLFIGDAIDKLDSFEYLIPEVITRAIKDGKITMEVLSTDSKWEGVTYKEDKEQVVKAIRTLIDNKVYDIDLWK